MIQISSVPATSAPHAARAAILAGGGAKGFTLALAPQLPPGTDVSEAEPGTVAPDLPGRQKIAAGGKDLPDESTEDGADTSDKHDKDGADAPFAWFAQPLPAPQPAAAVPPVLARSVPPKDDAPIVLDGLPLPAAQPGTSRLAPAPAEREPATVPFAAAPAVPGSAAEHAPASATLPIPAQVPAAQPVASTAAPASATADAAAGQGGTPHGAPATVAPTPQALPALSALAVPPAPIPAAGPVARDSALPPRAVADIAKAAGGDARRAVSAQRPATSQPAVQPVRQPASIALQPLAAPLAAAQAEATAPRRADPRDPITGVTAALADAVRPTAVQATTEAQHAPLDLRHQEWTGAMLDRIEALRDSVRGAGGTRETNIRLAPDALGTVDIAIRRDGDRLHVHFTAETQAARTALSDAQPRLAELAEARGIKLGQTTVDGGAGQGGQRQSATAATPAPRPASANAGAEGETDPDQRIA